MIRASPHGLEAEGLCFVHGGRLPEGGLRLRPPRVAAVARPRPRAVVRPRLGAVLAPPQPQPRPRGRGRRAVRRRSSAHLAGAGAGQGAGPGLGAGCAVGAKVVSPFTASVSKIYCYIVARTRRKMSHLSRLSSWLYTSLSSLPLPSSPQWRPESGSRSKISLPLPDLPLPDRELRLEPGLCRSPPPSW